MLSWRMRGVIIRGKKNLDKISEKLSVGMTTGL